MIMKEELIKLKNKNSIVFLPKYDLEIRDSLDYTLGNIVLFEKPDNEKEILEIINNSKIKKIYLVGNDDFYRYLLPRKRLDIKVCWIFKNSFSDLSNPGVRYVLNCIFEFIDRKLIDTIGCISKDNLKVFENAGYACEFINLDIKHKRQEYKESNTIGILSNDYDPNNNFYNQLASLTYVDYDYCKFNYVMKATKDFIPFFNLKCIKEDNIDNVIKDNFVNLYANFTNTNIELIRKSFDLGIPCIVGNTDIFDNNKYLKEHLVLKSDDNIREISKKIDFVRENRERIMEEYNKLECL